MTKASASGKIILFGEHAVVYGHPALAVPVNQVHADAEVSDIDRAGIWIDAPDIGLHEELSRLAPDHPLATVINGVFSATDSHLPEGEGLGVRVKSTIPLASGLGSGAAVSVAIIRALSAHLKKPLDNVKISELAYEVEKIHHGTPSGIDNTVVTYGMPIFFAPPSVPPASGGETLSPPFTGEMPEGLRGQITPLQVAKSFTIIIGDTGLPAPTKESVSDVRKLWKQNPSKMEALFAAAGSIAKTARQAIEGGHPERLGPLMNENHSLLQEMTVSSPELDRLTEASLRSGALGAKLSGGGRGGNMIALSTKEKAPAIAKALLEMGAKNVIVTEIS